MTPPRRRTPLPALLTALAVALTACGGPAQDTTSDPTAVDTASEPSDVPPTGGSEASSSSDPTAAGPSSDPTAAGPSSEPTAAGPSSDPAAAATGATADGVLRLGSLLPESGPLAEIGPPQVAAFELAVEEVNAAGGVLGAPIEAENGDEGGDAGTANQTVDRLLDLDVDGIVGASSSAVSLQVIDKITGARVLQCSGSNTSRTFTDYADDGFYSRAVPTNLLQAPVFADTIVADGAATVALLVRADDYGESLGDAIATSLEEVGAQVVEQVFYEPNAPTFDVEVGQAVDAEPDAVVVVAFDEGTRILQTLIERGSGPGELPTYVTDGMGFADLGTRVSPDDPAAVAGMTGVTTSSETDPEFLDRLRASDPGIEGTAFAPYVYDCVVTIALAAEVAGTDDPAAIRDELVGVTRDGEPCADFATCRDLAAEGTDIDYDGVSGPLEYVPAAEPATGIYDIVEFGADGAPTVADTVEIEGVAGDGS